MVHYREGRKQGRVGSGRTKNGKVPHFPSCLPHGSREDPVARAYAFSVLEHEVRTLGGAVYGTLSLQGLPSLSFAILAPFFMSEEHLSHCLRIGWLFFSYLSGPRRSLLGIVQRKEETKNPPLQAFGLLESRPHCSSTERPGLSSAPGETKEGCWVTVHKAQEVGGVLALLSLMLSTFSPPLFPTDFQGLKLWC